MTRKYPDIDRDELLLLNRSGMTYAELAVRFNVTRNQVASWINQAKGKPTATEKKFDVAYHPAVLKLSGDFLIVGDVHVPTTDYQLARLVSRIGQKHLKHPRLIIAGDFFNMDAFSSYTPTAPSYSWREERAAGTELFRMWLDTFEEIYVIMGNHDRRIQKWSQAQLEENDIFGMVVNHPKVTVSNVGWLTVDTLGGPYRVTHARNYSVNALSVANDLANKFQSHIIQFHEHHLGMSWDRYGHYLVVNGGGLFDPDQMIYAILDDSKSAAMKQGFVLLKNGTPHLLGNAPFTCWSEWL